MGKLVAEPVLSVVVAAGLGLLGTAAIELESTLVAGTVGME